MTNKPSIDKSWTEPNSSFNAKYPYNKVTMSESGHSFEMDDTPGAERIRLQHRSGTFFEMYPDGQEVHKIFGDGYEITANNRYVKISGTCNITIEGDALMHVYGDSHSVIEKNSYQIINGESELNVNGRSQIHCNGDVDVTAYGTDSDINLNPSGAVNINGTLNVTGEINSSASINAKYNVNAGYKHFAIGGLETIGGLNVGLSNPGSAIPPGIITATNLVTSPVVQGQMVMDHGGPMDLIRVIFNVHTHPDPQGGSTGVAIPQMII